MPPMAPDEFDLHLQSTPDGRLISVTLQPIAKRHLGDALAGRQFTNLTEGDPGNLLLNASFAGPIVRDWLQEMAARQGATLRDDLPPVTKPATGRALTRCYELRDQTERMRRIIEATRRPKLE